MISPRQASKQQPKGEHLTMATRRHLRPRRLKINLLASADVASGLAGLGLVAALACLLVSQASTHSQALASNSPDTSQQQDGHQNLRPTQNALHYLLYNNNNNNNSKQQGAGQQQQPQAQLQQRRPLTPDEEALLKDVNHDHTSKRVNMELARDIWKRMHANALEFAQLRTNQSRPAVGQFLQMSGVSSKCKAAIDDMLEHIGRLDDWAMRMFNSFGDFPASGFFEGTMTSMGSYHQCVNVAPNQWIERPQFCSFKFQPVVPTRPRYHNILATIDERLANFTGKEDMFRGFAKKAHYFYYTKLRLATCMPSKCAKSDLDLIGEQIALNTYLQYQGIECLEKEPGFDPDGAQVFAMVILFSLASVSVLGTIVHLLDVRAWLEPARRGEQAPGCGSPLSSVPIELAMAAKLKSADKQPLASTRVVIMPDERELENNNNNNNSNNNNINNNNINNNNISSSNNNNHGDEDELAQSRVSRKSLPMLASPASDLSVGSSGRAQRSLPVRIVDVLLHFSMIGNARKLFDTSTSAGRGNSRPGSLLGGQCAHQARAHERNRRRRTCSSSSPSAGSSAAQIDGSLRSDLSSVEGQSNDISCVHGLRFWTISWIILGHTMQYTEWAGFARTYQVEGNITSFLLHPLLNATFSVDTFFLISGLLTTYVTWTITRGHYWRFNKFAFLISRYLRLMPQVLIVILIFILFPMLGEGPWWRGVIQKESDRCKQNWWVSALFLQSFYRQDQICNLVTWWLSIEMFYHFTSIFVIIALLHSPKKGIFTAVLMGGSMTAYSCYLHYVNLYPPNMMPTLLQRYEIWNEIVLKYFWTPYPHAPSYFMGLILGYVLYNRSIGQPSRRQVRLGWCAFAVCYTAILFGTYGWNLNAPYSQVASTAYYNLSQVFWSLATAWAILACALGHGGWLNEFLSSPVFIPLGRATYMTYLSHMLIVMSYPAKMNQLIEPSYIIFLYIFISNLVLSYALGICLTLVYESPILHLQKLLVARMASKFNEDPRMKKREKASEHEKAPVRVALYAQAPQPQQHQHQQQQEQHLLGGQTLNMEFPSSPIATSVCH